MDLFWRERPRAGDGYVSGGFTLDGEDLWAATPEAVIHFDGQHWRKFPVEPPPDSVAAGNHEAWTIEAGGILGDYTDGGVENVDMRDSIPAAGGVRSTRPAHSYWRWTDLHPSIARTADGTLWIVWGGLWRLDHVRDGVDQWTRVPAAYNVRLLRATLDLLWLFDRQGLVDLSTGQSIAPPKLKRGPSAIRARSRRSRMGDHVAQASALVKSIGFCWRFGAVSRAGHGLVSKARTSAIRSGRCMDRFFPQDGFSQPGSWLLLVRSI